MKKCQKGTRDLFDINDSVCEGIINYLHKMTFFSGP